MERAKLELAQPEKVFTMYSQPAFANGDRVCREFRPSIEIGRARIELGFFNALPTAFLEVVFTMNFLYL